MEQSSPAIACRQAVPRQMEGPKKQPGHSKYDLVKVLKKPKIDCSCAVLDVPDQPLLLTFRSRYGLARTIISCRAS